MNPFEGLIDAIDEIEYSLTGEIDYEAAARRAALSVEQLRRVFGALFGCTLGEYVRKRRLTLAGAELAGGQCRVIDAALKYGYDTPESFARAFVRFHGVTPSQTRQGAELRAFSRISVRLIMEGGLIMNYRIEEKDELILTGYTRRFAGTPIDPGREGQECGFYVHTRAEQYLLRGLRSGFDEADYNVIVPASEDGYDFSIAAHLKGETRSRLTDDTVLGIRDADRFHEIVIPRHLYAVFRTEACLFPTQKHIALRQEIAREWLPSSGYALSSAPEVQVIHWYPKPRQNERYIELWLPVEPAVLPQ